MASKILVGALTKKYAELLGEYQVAEREIEEVSGLKNIQVATEKIDAKKAVRLFGTRRLGQDAFD